jgi:uncharacterized protein (TIGR02145 family)
MVLCGIFERTKTLSMNKISIYSSFFMLATFLFSCGDSSVDVGPTVTIGDQVWTRTNLSLTKFKNGEEIPEAKTATEWAAANNAKQPAWCYYENNANNEATYGKLYNFYAISDERGLIPEGWRIPTDQDWNALTMFLGGEGQAGGKMKEEGTSNWAQPNVGATNESGFTGRPGGFRTSTASFASLSGQGVWWSSTSQGTEFAWVRDLNYSNAVLFRYSSSKSNGYSVRLIKE